MRKYLSPSANNCASNCHVDTVSSCCVLGVHDPLASLPLCILASKKSSVNPPFSLLSPP
ncbi:hypothetical protein BOTBODRAFT_503054 [Botryobasidium botryosum FD-172 SS1]|uniref:Uncharacterized protein n=1 Tax=Botryobasidium botryosum (strain FD-172 SS1) TaxID=930990 RepID=A0A067M353_BOTB1|nr:hypothetical protein BOTBODRAFT_503054 [Botryobasidium botryosum FD-172 SS1]